MTDWIVGFIEEYGYAAVALLMLAENVFPPIPSELIMPFAGFAASGGEIDPWLVAAAGAAGSVAGALFWYAVGRWVGPKRLLGFVERHGRWLTLAPDDVRRAQQWFDAHGHAAVFFGRLMPAVRTLISVPAGISGMRLGEFLLWTVAGSLVWSGVLTFVGFQLGERYEAVSGVLDWVTKAVLAAIAIWYVRRVVRGRRQ
jgi:membrane protein DedA with SNARE-associated domain